MKRPPYSPLKSPHPDPTHEPERRAPPRLVGASASGLAETVLGAPLRFRGTNRDGSRAVESLHEPRSSRRKEALTFFVRKIMSLLTSAATVQGFNARNFCSGNSLPAQAGSPSSQSDAHRHASALSSLRFALAAATGFRYLVPRVVCQNPGRTSPRQILPASFKPPTGVSCSGRARDLPRRARRRSRNYAAPTGIRSTFSRGARATAKRTPKT